MIFLKKEARWTGKISSLPHRIRETAEKDYYFQMDFWLYNVLMCPNLTDAIAIGCVMFTWILLEMMPVLPTGVSNSVKFSNLSLASRCSVFGCYYINMKS